jgi:RNA polymerase sigma-70 factor (ECF subfamily)
VQLSDRPETNPTDIALLERIVSGDQAAVADLYDRHSRLIFGLILRVLRDRGDAEEVMQEVFFSVWSRAASYNASLGTPVVWLARMARNRAIDRLRANQVRVRTAAAIEEPSGPDSPESSAVRNEESAVVRRALATLPDEQRMLIEQAYYAGLTQSELAAHFGLPLGTVKTRVRTGMISLREQLATYE